MESSWVRSTYLYLMCIVSFALVLYGVGSVAVGLVHTVSPDLGHRDTLDRVGIGLSNVAEGVLGIVDESQRASIEEFCEDFADDDEFDECVDDELRFASPFPFGDITDGIDQVRGELESQIRNSSIDRMIRGLVMVVAGFVLWRVHAGRTDVFRDGLMPARPVSTPPLAPTEVALRPLPTTPRVTGPPAAYPPPTVPTPTVPPSTPPTMPGPPPPS